jgi:monoterpene epsilon-lactone hydrolase
MPKLWRTTAALLLALSSAAGAQTLAPREEPAKSIPVPTDVSPQMQAIIAAPLRTGWNVLPKTGEEWHTTSVNGGIPTTKLVNGWAEQLHVKIEPGVIDGVKVFTLTPAEIPPQNEKRLLVHVHGGCYLLNPDVAGLTDAVLLAGFGHFKVIAVNYRMPPEAYFPAALDDAMTVYKAALKMAPAKDIGVFGMSAGGALTLEMMLRAKQDGLAMPAAIAPGTPMADATKVGDSFQTNEMVDNVLVSRDGFCDAATVFYAHGHDLKDPLISPIYGDMHGFPPAILTTGTRDLLLSNTVRTHRKLREAGVEAVLQVYEGQSHAEFARDVAAPETAEAFGEIAAFFDAHLGRE